MEKKKKTRILLFLALLAVVAVLALSVYQYTYMKQYVKINGELVSREAETLDLRGAAVEDLSLLEQLVSLKWLDIRDTGLTEAEYLSLKQALPECRILWSVPFQGGYVDSDAETLATAQLSEEDIPVLCSLESLKAVDLRGCRDYEAIRKLKQSGPELDIQFDVELGGNIYSGDVRELELENISADVMEQVLPVLSALQRVTFAGETPADEQIRRWKEEYPQVVFVWQFDVCGVSASSLDTELILNDIPMESVEEVETALGNFYDLQWVEMCNCGIPSTEMDALWKRHPETRFVWMVQVGVCNLRTDIQVFMPYQYGYDGYSALFDRHMEEMKYCVDLICMDMGHMCISDYSFLAYMPHMQYLILADTPGTDFSVLAELKELKFLEIFMTTFDQAEVLTGLTSLEDLNIGNSSLDNIEPLLEMTWLKRLWVPGNVKISYEERKQLREGLTDTIVMFATNSSTGGGWRESPNYYAMRDLLGMGYFTK